MTNKKYRSEEKGLLDVCAVKIMSKKNLICIPLYHGINFFNHESNEKHKSGGIS